MLAPSIEVQASALDEDLVPSTDWRGILRGLSQLTQRLDFPEATQACHRGPHHNSKGPLPQLEKNQEILPLTRNEAYSTVTSREKSHLPS